MVHETQLVRILGSTVNLFCHGRHLALGVLCETPAEYAQPGRASARVCLAPKTPHRTSKEGRVENTWIYVPLRPNQVVQIRPNRGAYNLELTTDKLFSYDLIPGSPGERKFLDRLQPNVGAAVRMLAVSMGMSPEAASQAYA